MLTLLAAITVSALITTKERTATKVSFNDVTPLLQFLAVNMLLIISNFGRVYFLSTRKWRLFSIYSSSCRWVRWASCVSFPPKRKFVCFFRVFRGGVVHRVVRGVVCWVVRRVGVNR